jgi:hypothetical protein
LLIDLPSLNESVFKRRRRTDLGQRSVMLALLAALRAKVMD